MNQLPVREPREAPPAPARPSRRRASGAAGEHGSLLRQALLLSPMALLLTFAFMVPVALFLLRAIDNPEIPDGLPETVAVLEDWDGAGLPPDPAFAALGRDLVAARAEGRLGSLARRLNFQSPGLREALMATVRILPAGRDATKAEVIAANAAWSESRTWALLRQESGRVTSYYLLAALDLRLDPEDGLSAMPPERAFFVAILLRTFLISGSVTVLCLLLGYPLAWGMAHFGPRTARILLIFVLLPFWMSILVRTTGWIILLQSDGPIDRLLQWSGLVSAPVPLIYNRVGVLVAMTHIMLPFMVLPLYSIMKGISPVYVRAAGSLGANGFRTFFHVYFPMTIPGVGAGALLTWILSLGYYITPALVGGAGDQMISNFIAFYTNQTINWGQAAALSVWLLLSTLVLLVLFRRIADVRQIGMR